jgi:hypothetical protein
MSERRVAALVCEGQTDVPIFRALIQKLWPEVEEVLCLQPELDEMERQKSAAGWTQVMAWCQANAGRIEEVLHSNLGDPIDLLLVAVDVDIAVHAGITSPPKDPGAYETPRLRATMKGWLAPTDAKMPSSVVLSTPVTAVEAWIIAALYPHETNPERISAPADWLMKKKKLRRSAKDGRPWKELHVYRGWAPSVAAKTGRIRKVCSEAERTFRAIEALRNESEG